jgi:hypothetical protein
VQIIVDWADGVNDLATGQIVTLRDLGGAGRAAIEGAALLEKASSGGSVDRSVDAATAEEGLVRCVDNGINL